MSGGPPLDADRDGSSTLTLTGVQGIDHVALTVPDLDEAIAFFEVLGGRVVSRLGPFPARPTAATSSTPDRFGRHPETRPAAIAMVRVGGAVFELFEFIAPDQRRDLPRWSDYGSYHLALRVDEVAVAAAQLQRAGLELLGEIGGGPEPGMQVVFTRTSWGLIVELLSYGPDSVLATAMSSG